MARLTRGGPEPRRAVGGAGQPAFGSGWSNFGSGYQPLRFYKLDGRVYVAGVVASSGAAAGLFVLPAGYRPAEISTPSAVLTGGTHTNLVVQTNGNVEYGGGAVAFLAFEFSFVAV